MKLNLDNIWNTMLAIGVVTSLASGGTFSLFNDTEVATASLSAGTLDLQLDSADQEVALFSVTNAAPGDTGSGSTVISNTGSLPGDLSAAFTVTDTADDGALETQNGLANLGSTALLGCFMDLDNSGTFDAGESGFDGNGAFTHAGTGGVVTTTTFNSYHGDSLADLIQLAAAGDLNGADALTLRCNWEIPQDAGNEIQGDSVSITGTFSLDQVVA